jgi:hypothetical protein
MLEEYDFRGGVRGKYAGRFKGDAIMVALEPDVAKLFPDAKAVNEALRMLIRVSPTSQKERVRRSK